MNEAVEQILPAAQHMVETATNLPLHHGHHTVRLILKLISMLLRCALCIAVYVTSTHSLNTHLHNCALLVE